MQSSFLPNNKQNPFLILPYALSFYRSQNALGWSNFFVPDQKFIYIKFGYSEKATNFEKNLPLSLWALSKYPNHTQKISCVHLENCLRQKINGIIKMNPTFFTAWLIWDGSSQNLTCDCWFLCSPKFTWAEPKIVLFWCSKQF